MLNVGEFFEGVGYVGSLILLRVQFSTIKKLRGARKILGPISGTVLVCFYSTVNFSLKEQIQIEWEFSQQGC